MKTEWVWVAAVVAVIAGVVVASSGGRTRPEPQSSQTFKITPELREIEAARPLKFVPKDQRALAPGVPRNPAGAQAEEAPAAAVEGDEAAEVAPPSN